MSSLITLGLSQIMVGTAATNGTMPTVAKIGKTYEDTCKMTQASAEVTEHYEEGVAAPSVRNKKKRMPVLTFSIFDPDPALLAAYIGGSVNGTSGAWEFNGEVVSNAAIQVQTEQGLWIDIPNGDVEAVINAEFSSKGLFRVDFSVTPLAVSAGAAISAYDGTTGLTVDPLLLNFTDAADAVGQEITADSDGNVTYAGAEAGHEWLTVTRAAKVVTVKVLANANSESRTASVTIIADGLRAVVPVTQAGAS